ncbi:MAG TPA: long-chain fatty aldehyde decarbonylase [Prochlorococcus sp.]|nr:long-chain fatty aldehyde decarbonylase [Prochlorococcus sp.]
MNIQSKPLSVLPNYASDSYLDAFSRINGLVIIGEGIACRHFRYLARAIPDDRDELLRLADMEARHASDFVGCANNLKVKPDLTLAKRLFQPLHDLFLSCERDENIAGCLTIQGVIVECFALAAYQNYLPVADSYASPITAAVIDDESLHLSYAERWLKLNLTDAKTIVVEISRKALPIALAILKTLAGDMRKISIEPEEIVASFSEGFKQSMESIGLSSKEVNPILIRAVASI